MPKPTQVAEGEEIQPEEFGQFRTLLGQATGGEPLDQRVAAKLVNTTGGNWSYWETGRTKPAHPLAIRCALIFHCQVRGITVPSKLFPKITDLAKMKKDVEREVRAKKAGKR